MVLRVSTTKIVSQPISATEEVAPEETFISIDTFVETSKKDEFIIGNLFDYDGKKIQYIWDSKKNQIASLKGKKLSTEVVFSANEFLKNLYIKPDPKIDAQVLSTQILDKMKELSVVKDPVRKPLPQYVYQDDGEELEEIEDHGFSYDYEGDITQPVFAGEFLADDEEPDDFDEKLALKSQEYLKEHPELKSEMEIVRLLEGN
jgi:hypothetical protein